MSEELVEARERLDDARRQKEEAGSLVAALEERVRAGDEEVAALELGEQHGLLRLAELQQERAEQRVREAEAAELAQRRRAAEAAAVADFEILSVDRLAQALDLAVQALTELKRLGDARQTAVDRHARAFLDLGMTDKIRHQDGRWIVFEADGGVYDTVQDGCQGAKLVELAVKELTRREQDARRQVKGHGPVEPLPHPVARCLAAGRRSEAVA
ncbi:hypothetical protein [Streptomyces lincolnensis]|uniref:hypothetical protein n=1 Tax=Streptomyces lincolnensis TaxID=1915 RepID=UPI0037D33CDD